MTDQPTLLKVEGLSKRFTKEVRRSMLYGMSDLGRQIIGLKTDRGQLRKGEFFGLHKIDLELRTGEILAVVGVNGSGKTTLMRMISGIYEPDTGVVRGRPDLDITAIFALSAGMQAMFSGRENVYIKGAMYGMTKEQIDAKISFIESFSELGDRIDRPFGNYSSGMKARLSYSIAMATDPDVFIIDESLAVGDSAFKAKCLDNLRSFVEQPGKAVIFVSNQIGKVLKVADRLIVMEKGRIIHRTEDVPAGLDFYIRNCYSDLDPQKQAAKIEKIRNYEL
ncbi:ABC transporter ATP-binding protein [Lewinella sp. 4G2]|uniref:ABC transporter ATP-binding protein n=1 Tax=Lewinella sp. 4G2 TaxID=1803372 RepID=UPI0007B4B852|nr:ABC transporter ATP-binding protein [Lewinella sp. 4G2]OAV44840.1 hypothetical protein A3850_010210 [Lewinella sp. 4G2]